jgi:opacity protein-like surface antigen
MTRLTWRWVAVCAMACIATVGTAQAQQLGFYVGGSFGQGDKAAEKAPFDTFATDIYAFFGFTPATSSSKLDPKDSTFGFVAGYRLLPNLAFEGGYMELGAVSYRSNATGSFGVTPSGLTLNVDTETSGIALSALGVLPLSYRAEVYARVGILFSTTDFNIYLSDGTDALRDSFSESSTDYLAGVGAGFSFAEVYTARIEYQRVFDAGAEDAGGEADVDVITLGFTVAF